MVEADLYAPIKRFLEKQGYTVKGEIGECDVIAIRGDEPPVVVELKERLNLALVLQSVDRLGVTDSVYVAFRVGKGHSATWRSQRKQVIRLLPASRARAAHRIGPRRGGRRPRSGGLPAAHERHPSHAAPQGIRGTARGPGVGRFALETTRYLVSSRRVALRTSALTRGRTQAGRRP